MFTMTFPPIADNTVTSAPCTKPRFDKNLLVSSLPWGLLLYAGSDVRGNAWKRSGRFGTEGSGHEADRESP